MIVRHIHLLYLYQNKLTDILPTLSSKRPQQVDIHTALFQGDVRLIEENNELQKLISKLEHVSLGVSVLYILCTLHMILVIMYYVYNI